MTETWRENWPRGVTDPYCPLGHLIETPTDHRLLRHIEGWLAVRATNDTLRQMATDIHLYLNETCRHHWHEYEADADIAAHRQCLWCHDVEWHEDVTK